jgi:hypothetical protein
MTYVPFGPADAAPQLWDTLVLNGTKVPGVATVEIGRKTKKDAKPAKGQNGSEQEFSGYEDATVKIRIVLWTKDQLDTFVEEVMPIIEPNADKSKVRSVTISHPVAQLRKVFSISVDDVVGPNRNERMWSIEVDATEVRPTTEKNAKGTFKGSPGRTKGEQTCQELAQQYREARAKQNRAQADSEALYRNSRSTGINGLDAEQMQIKALELEREAAGWAAQAGVIYSMMVGLGCTNKPPSGGPATQPD